MFRLYSVNSPSAQQLLYSLLLFSCLLSGLPTPLSMMTRILMKKSPNRDQIRTLVRSFDKRFKELLQIIA